MGGGRKWVGRRVFEGEGLEEIGGRSQGIFYFHISIYTAVAEVKVSNAVHCPDTDVSSGLETT